MDEPENPEAQRPRTDSAFESLLWELFLRFVDLPGDQVDAVIRDALRRLAEALELDRAGMWQSVPGDVTDMYVTHVYENRDLTVAVDALTGSVQDGVSRIFPLASAEPYPALTSASEAFPWITSRLWAGLTTVVPSVEALPAAAAVDAESLRRVGTRSTVIVPLKTEAGVVGCVTFASTSKPRTWSDGLVRRFELVAQVFARALNAKHTNRLEREHQARLSLAAASAGAGLWDLDIRTGRLRATDVAKRLYGFTPEEDVTVDKVLSVVHPDDRDQYASRLRWCRDHDDSYSQEYRLLLPDGSIRWINSRGKPFASEPGQPPDRVFGASIDITDRKRAEEQLRSALADIQQRRDQLQQDNRSLRDEVRRRGVTAQVVGTSAAVRAALALANQVAPTGATVLLLGETGTGKERFANYVHEHSPRRSRSMVRVNCSAIPITLIESELFGRERGAFTGALARQIGRFELAAGSTIFLDEIGDLPLDVQVKLLRVIEERSLERLGSPHPIAVDVRIIAATNRDLGNAVREGRFREDLYYRLNVFPIALPPLRDRVEDIPLLARAMIDELSHTIGRRFDSLTQPSLEALRQYRWPGNIRELRNLIERAMITSTPPTLTISVPETSPVAGPATPAMTLKDVERTHILSVLVSAGWRIRGPHGAAALLGIPPTTLESRMKKLGISRPHPADGPR